MNKKLLNLFIGAIDERDEYQQQEIYKEFAFSGIVLWFFTMLLMFLSIVLDTIHDQLSFITLSLLAINMLYAIYVTRRLQKKQLHSTDCASLEEYKEKKKRLKKSSALAGSLWSIFMVIVMQYLFPYLSTGEINVSWANILTWFVAGGAFSVALYWFSKSKLIKHF